MRGCSGGVCGCSGGMHGCSVGHAWLLRGGHAWLLQEGMHGCSQGGMRGLARGHAWFFLGGVHGFFMVGCAWFFPGACMVFSGGACIGYDEIRSMSGRYASYWNAFLFTLHSYCKAVFLAPEDFLRKHNISGEYAILMKDYVILLHKL